MESHDPVTFISVYQEFNERIAERFKITKFKSRVSNKYFSLRDDGWLPVRKSHCVPKTIARIFSVPGYPGKSSHFFKLK